MKKNQNILKFPDPVETKKNKYIKIRDEIEKILYNHAVKENDLWAVSLGSGKICLNEFR